MGQVAEEGRQTEQQHEDSPYARPRQPVLALPAITDARQDDADDSGGEQDRPDFGKTPGSRHAEYVQYSGHSAGAQG